MTQIDSNADNRHDEGHIPGESAFWVFIVGEMFMFSAFFLTFICNRAWTPENVVIFKAGQQTLSQFYGGLNTAILLTSSLFMVLALQAAREGMVVKGKKFIKLTMLCGTAFVVVKIFEYAEKIQAGYTLNTDTFYQIYYMFTIMHLIHLLTGTTVLLCLYTYCFKENCAEPNNIRLIEGGACYWHLVDLFWVGLFTLIYLVR